MCRIRRSPAHLRHPGASGWNGVCPMVPLHMCAPVPDQGSNTFLGDLCKPVITRALKLIDEAVSTIDLPGNPLAARAFPFHHASRANVGEAGRQECRQFELRGCHFQYLRRV